MRRHALAFIIVTATSAIGGCHRQHRPVAASNPPEPIESPNPPETSSGANQAPVVVANWSGSWSSDFGNITLEQQGTRVTGQYSYDHGGVQILGAIEGEVMGNRLDFAWSESPGGGGAGHANFTMSNDGRSFTGTWGQGESRTSGGNWNGKRM